MRTGGPEVVGKLPELEEDEDRGGGPADEDARGPASDTIQVLAKAVTAAVSTVPIQVARRFHQGGGGLCLIGFRLL